MPPPTGSDTPRAAGTTASGSSRSRPPPGSASVYGERGIAPNRPGDPRRVVLARVPGEAELAEDGVGPDTVSVHGERRGAVSARRAAGELLDHRDALLDVGAELVRRLQEGALVPEAVRGRVVASRQHLLDEVRVVLRGQAEEEERRLRVDLVQEAEDGIHLAHEGRVRGVPAGHPGTTERQLLPVLEVDAEQQRPVVHRRPTTSWLSAAPSLRPCGGCVKTPVGGPAPPV